MCSRKGAEQEATFYLNRVNATQTIISLDDDPTFQNRLELQFSANPFFKVQTVAQFINRLTENPTALCLIDLDFGGEMSGVELISKYNLHDAAVLVSGRIWSDQNLMMNALVHRIRMCPKDCIQNG